MHSPFSAGHIPAIVFTDLDGTLLDHHSYSFEPAKPAIERLKQLAIPLVLVTSKTSAEVALLKQELGNPHPFVFENGAGLIIPKGYFANQSLEELDDGSSIQRFSPTYLELREQITQWRTTYSFKLEGFGDWSASDVAKHTGLDIQHSTLAKQRLGSEPFLWQDTAEKFEFFQELVTKSNLSCVQGGRFYHLLGRTNKAQAAKSLLSFYKKTFDIRPLTIALGDSANDIPLLEIAETAVVIKRYDNSHMIYKGSNSTIYTDGQGPSGWNEALQHLLTQLENDNV